MIMLLAGDSVCNPRHASRDCHQRSDSPLNVKGLNLKLRRKEILESIAEGRRVSRLRGKSPGGRGMRTGGERRFDELRAAQGRLRNTKAWNKTV